MIPIVSLIAAALVAAVGAWRWARRSPGTQASSPPARAVERFAAVEIRRRGGSCAAARAYDGQRFLANRSPALPLAGCTKARCECRFVKLSDRRADERRWGHGGLSAALFAEEERRQRADRRDPD